MKYRLKMALVSFLMLTFITTTAWSNDLIIYDSVAEKVSAQIPEGQTLAKVLKVFGEKTGINVSIEKYLMDFATPMAPLSFDSLSIEEAVATLTAPYYFKIFVTISDLSDINSATTYDSLVVYRKWQNNEPLVALNSSLKRKNSGNLNARIIGTNGEVTGKRAGVKDWDPGDSTGSKYPFSYGFYDQYTTGNYWIDDAKNPAIANTTAGTVYFAYLLGKDNHSTTLVKAHANRETVGGKSNVLTFTFDIIKGQLDSNGNSEIDYFTVLSVPDEYSGNIALKTNIQTLPSWEESGGSTVNMPSGDFFIKDYTNKKGWTFEFDLKTSYKDKYFTTEHIINASLSDGYYLAYVEGGSNAVDINSFKAFCLVHAYSNKARLMVLDQGYVDDDGDVFVNKFTLVKTLSANSQNFDNVVYKKYQDMFLLSPLDKTSSNTSLLAETMPSHLLYSIEDYLWDPVRFKVVPQGQEIPNPYISSDSNAEGTVGKMFADFKANTVDIPADDQRIPIIFIHGWQGDKSNGFDILKGYKLGNTGKIADYPGSGEAYWRNLLTYMYKYHADEFKKYKPYVYHHPSYKHVTFNGRMLESLINDIRNDTNGSSLEYGYDNNKIILIGHSMGTIISRSVMEEHNLFSHVQKFVSLAGVHHGSPGSIGTLVDTTAAASVSWLAGKDFYSPGACDLMSDNYDGLLSNKIKADIQSNNWAAYELLGQRAQAGCLYVSGNYYSDRASFDLHYIDLLTGGSGGNPADNNNWYVKDQEVPVYSNPWLLNMNQKFITNYKNTAKDKYFLYTGYIVDNPIIPRFSTIPEDPLWTNTLSGSTPMNVAGSSVSGASNYWFTDSCVPISYGILDTSRGDVGADGNSDNPRLLKSDGSINTDYNKAVEMADVPVLGGLENSVATRNKLKSTYFYKVNNSWGAPSRIVYDHDHDQILNGGYGDVALYRQNLIGQGQSYKTAEFFAQYLSYVHPNLTETPEMRFANDPVFEQIRLDLNGGDVASECEVATIDSDLDVYIPFINNLSSREDLPVAFSAILSFAPQDGRITFKFTDLGDVTAKVGLDGQACDSANFLPNQNVQIPKLYYKTPTEEQVFSTNCFRFERNNDIFYEIDNEDLKKVILENVDTEPACTVAGGEWTQDQCTIPACVVPTLSEDLTVSIPYLNLLAEDNKTIQEVWSATLAFEPQAGDDRILFKVTNSVDYAKYTVGKDGETCVAADLLNNYNVHIPNLNVTIPNHEQVLIIDGTFTVIGDSIFYAIDNDVLKQILLDVQK